MTPTCIKFSEFDISPAEILQRTQKVQEEYGLKLRSLSKLEFMDDYNEVGYVDDDDYLFMPESDESSATNRSKEWEGFALRYVIRPLKDLLSQLYWIRNNKTRVIIDIETSVPFHVTEDWIEGQWLENYIIDYTISADADLCCYGCCGEIKSPLKINAVLEGILGGAMMEQRTFVLVIKEHYLQKNQIEEVLQNKKILTEKYEQRDGYHVISSVARKVKPFVSRV